MTKKLKISPLGLETQVVCIRLTFWDESHTYKEFDMVTHRSVLLKMAKSCRNILSQDETLIQKIYEEIIYRAFKPKVKLDDFYTSVLKYICCHTKYGLNEHSQDVDKIVSHINIENDDESVVYLLSPPLSRSFLREEPSKLYGKSETSIALPSKLGFLTPRETRLLFGIQDFISKSPNKTSFLFSYSELVDCVMEDETEGKLRDTIDYMLETLIFYEFITLEYKNTDKGDHYYLNISLRDAEVYSEFLNMIENSQSA